MTFPNNGSSDRQQSTLGSAHQVVSKAVSRTAFKAGKLITLVGPTAVGKSDVAFHLAKAIDGEIVSADSMQVYRGMDIGTAKPSSEERTEVKHHLIGIAEPSEAFSVALYQKLAREAVSLICEKGKWPLLVGGSGLYIRAVIDPLEFPPEEETASGVRPRLEKRADLEGSTALYEELKRSDPEAAEFIHPNNTRRVIRALEVIETTGRPFSEFHRDWQNRESLYQLEMYGLTMERTRLYAKINARVDQQIERGLVAEVKGLVERGYGGFLTSSQALGYKEIVDYLKGDIGLNEAIDLIKRRTRRFARRQLTWFRADSRVIWLDATDQSPAALAGKIQEDLLRRRFV